MNPNEPLFQTTREIHISLLLAHALPYLEREELGTRSDEKIRVLIAAIKEAIS